MRVDQCPVKIEMKLLNLIRETRALFILHTFQYLQFINILKACSLTFFAIRGGRPGRLTVSRKLQAGQVRTKQVTS
jgi:hypothetical protein